MAYLQVDPDLSAVRLDSPVVRAHVSASGAPQNREADPALGRSWGGFDTQIHVLADRRGRPLRLRVTGGQTTTAPRREIWWKPGRARRGPA